MQYFSDLASGKKGSPINTVELDTTLLKDQQSLYFSEIRSKYAGIFNQHFVASIPYILEEQCRFGSTVINYAEYIRARYGRNNFNIYTLGDGPGVMSRALSDASNGKIYSLCCSPNTENFHTFNAKKPNKSAYFYLGPFYEVNRKNLAKKGINDFKDGFDIIVEDTTFQMYGKSRLIPIYLANRNLRDDGLFIFLEKFSNNNKEEFIRREKQKDNDFKSRFFLKDQIECKKKSIIQYMDENLTTIQGMGLALSNFFCYAVITWSSGNFATIVASNNLENLKKFVSLMTPPAIPSNYCYFQLPKILLGHENSIQFR